MFNYKTEGVRIRNGFNFWRLSDPDSFGFAFKLGKVGLWFRYSKRVKQWFIHFWKDTSSF